jgi:hypothetical protein
MDLEGSGGSSQAEHALGDDSGSKMLVSAVAHLSSASER